MPTLINNDANGEPIDFTEGTASQYVMYDGFGDMIGTVDSSGANTSTYHLDPYGALLSITAGGDTAASQPKTGVASKTTTAKPGVKTLNATANAASGGESPFGIFGIEGAVSRYWKRGARWNDTFTGTWTSVDPITVLNNPGRANPYAYAGDNPLNLRDPSGQSFWSGVGDVAAGVGGAVVGGLVGGAIGFAVSGGNPIGAAIGGAAGAGCLGGAAGVGAAGGSGGDVAAACAGGAATGLAGSLGTYIVQKGTE